jgi:hypothetical protein
MDKLYKKAKRNAEYYLAEKLANGEDCWFRYVKTLEDYAEPVLISPAMAQEVLDANNVGEVTPVEKENPTVCISFNGKLLDGAGTLKWISLGEKSQIVFFQFNISDKLTILFN